MSGAGGMSKIDMDESKPLFHTKSTKSHRTGICAVTYTGIIVTVLVIIVVAAVFAIVVGLGVGLGVSRGDGALYDAITTSNLVGHLQELQKVAGSSFNNSRSVENGYNASAEYVMSRLQKAGYSPDMDHFTIPVFVDEGNAVFSAVLNINENDTLNLEFLQNNQFAVMRYSGNGTVTGAPLQFIDGGCDMEDFDGFIDDNIAFVDVSTDNCSLFVKANLSQSNGATAVIMSGLKPGGRPPTSRIYVETEDGIETVDLPIIGVTIEIGQLLLDLSEAGTLSITIETRTSVTMYNTYNVLAETKGGRGDSIIVVGTHLDSVPAGPGINDNGSGSAANLEMAVQIAQRGTEPVNKVRFAFWSGEELGLLGSTHYVNSLTEAEKDNIALNLNFDMIASPNYVRMIYNGSMASPSTVKGSVRIQNLFEERFVSQGLDHRLTPFTNRSDYREFIANGIPAGGLFTGAEEIKTEDERKKYGGLANAQLDACYHRDCDTVDNINEIVYEQMAQAAAYALEKLMMQEALKEYLSG